MCLCAELPDPYPDPEPGPTPPLQEPLVKEPSPDLPQKEPLLSSKDKEKKDKKKKDKLEDVGSGEAPRETGANYAPPVVQWVYQTTASAGSSWCSWCSWVWDPKSAPVPMSLTQKFWYSKRKRAVHAVVHAAPQVVEVVQPMTYAAPPQVVEEVVTYAAPVVQTYAAPVVYAPVVFPNRHNDDFCSQMSSEEYFNERVVPSIRCLARECPAMARSLKLSQIVIFLSGIVSSILGALGMSSLIPIVMGFSTLVTSLMHFHGYSTCLVAANGALSTLHAKSTLWTSQSKFERRNPIEKDRLMVATEEALCQVASAVAAASAAATGKVDKEVAEKVVDHSLPTSGKGRQAAATAATPAIARQD